MAKIKNACEKVVKKQNPSDIRGHLGYWVHLGV